MAFRMFCDVKKISCNTFDIHGGGRDLIFPHHENEIAQSLCANKTKNLQITGCTIISLLCQKRKCLNHKEIF